jgi:hypothetical protein
LTNTDPDPTDLLAGAAESDRFASLKTEFVFECRNAFPEVQHDGIVRIINVFRRTNLDQAASRGVFDFLGTFSFGVRDPVSQFGLVFAGCDDF